MMLPPTLLATCLALLLAACSADAPDASETAPGSSPSGGAKEVEDAGVAPFQRELLTLAFEAASKFPTFPHSKNRGRAQEEVLVACFELGLPKLALQFAPDTEGWRRGLAYADYAYYCAKQGVTKNVDRYLELAEAVASEESADPNAQQWRIDKVRLKIARAHAAMGRMEKAEEIGGAIEATSKGAVDANWSQTVSSWVAEMDLEQAREELAGITQTFENQSLGEQYSSLLVLSALHGRFFSDEAFRAELEERLLVRFFKLPPNLRLDAIAPMVGHYLDAEDLDGARNVIVRMAEILDGARWRTEDKVPQMARIAELHVDTGDEERARQELQQALELYQSGREDIFDINRCESLRPIALGFYKLGDREQGEGLLAVAVEEGVENPNARPRCDDLVATCVALAARGVEPSPALMARLREISAGLVDPW